MTKNYVGSKTFFRETGLGGSQMRCLEMSGVISPIRTDNGWRAYSQADVAAARAWKEKQTLGRSGDDNATASTHD